MKFLLKILLIIILLFGCKTEKDTSINESNITTDDTISITSNSEILEDSIVFNVEKSIRVGSSEYNRVCGEFYDVNLGTLSFKIDSIFIVDEISRVEAKIIKSINKDDVNNMIISYKYTKNGKVKTKQIQVDNIMSMELYTIDKHAFDITKLSSNNQNIDNNLMGEWIWSVKPLKTGEYGLIIKAIINNDNSVIERIVYDEIIYVKNKQKNKYKVEIYKSNVLLCNYDNNIKVSITKCDTTEDGFYCIDNGILYFDLNDNIVNFNDNKFNNQNYQEYNINVNPKNKGDFKLNINLKTDNENIIIYNETVKIKNDFFIWFKKIFIDLLSFYEFIISIIIIPLILFIIKKIKSKKSNKNI